ncbi:MAG: AraC family transcriptional regulator [Paracoccus sp.]|jgi:transcriptional regulator GlxA family with amidase domain|nr:AraC family transcriptional regulator [Paracoccus sp. (in: a-proteobacteria)]MBA50225.1 AraC family transcriptional regulator [Paracoccus sp. (in: a-proteobacteria)]HIC66649.1 GlxA family transcriptional regulator [Paracoccus sp. (in: a-proteobacteria)]|tara:strand:+ start:9892 stop:10968 length:1077 start_codon:yes stop_codon:yes gene_type:complete
MCLIDNKASPMSADKPRRFTFLLLDRFTMLPFAAAIEPLRLANRAAGKTLFEWRLIGPGGDVAVCSNGARVELDGGLDAEIAFGRDDVVILCGGIGIARVATKPVLNWLRKQARSGAGIGAVCTGAWVLAEAGLLDGRKATIHWENHDGLAEAFPEVDLYRSVFVHDGNRLTAAGGTSSIDLMLHLIAEWHGDALAAEVADQMLHTAIRTDQDRQRLSIPTRIGVRHPRLAAVIARMEGNLEDPISPATLARDAGMSTRQLERLFRRYLNRSPKRYYMETRLARARNLLMQTEMSIIEVALASGFSSPSHFSKCYRAQYGSTPYRERGTGAAPNGGENAPTVHGSGRPGTDRPLSRSR